MNSTRLTLWLVPLAIYLVFCVWYTNLVGPLTEQEITELVAQFENNGVPADRIDNLRRFMEEDTGRQFIMINSPGSAGKSSHVTRHWARCQCIGSDQPLYGTHVSGSVRSGISPGFLRPSSIQRDGYLRH